jgi:hypothetical protein
MIVGVRMPLTPTYLTRLQINACGAGGVPTGSPIGAGGGSGSVNGGRSGVGNGG